MITKLNMNKILISIIMLLTGCLAAAGYDTIPPPRSLQWRIGAEMNPAWVPGTNGFLKGENAEGKSIRSTFSGDIRADFSFSPLSREGMLYKGLYQGIGLGVNTFFSNSLLGTPLSIYVYQGAPIVYLDERLWLGYEWQFGVACGWKHFSWDADDDNVAVSTPVTAHMGFGLKFHYDLSDRWRVSAGLSANHYSNGNTSWPNAGVNTIGATVGFAYTLNPQRKAPAPDYGLSEEADKGRWLYDIVLYGSVRKRIVLVGEPPEPQLCPGEFGILGLQLSPMRSLNRWVAVGPSLDLQWDESAGLSQYWVDGTSGDTIKFRRPPFGKQIGVGLSAHAELTMPIFSVNAGIGYDIVTTKGDRAFYQSLTLKAFVSRRAYLNIGYRLGSFKEPQNLMLGIGVRL